MATLQKAHLEDGRLLALWQRNIPSPRRELAQAMKTYFQSLLEYEGVLTEILNEDNAYLRALTTRESE